MKPNRVTKFTVRRHSWLRGKGPPSSGLLVKSGKKCCLGFLCMAAGMTSKEINTQAYIEGAIEDLIGNGRAKRAANLADKLPKLVDKPFSEDNQKFLDSDLTKIIAETNDEKEITDADREKALKKLFRQAGIQISFTGRSE